MRENRLRWFWHIMRREKSEVLRKAVKINVRRKEREKNTENEVG